MWHKATPGRALLAASSVAFACGARGSAEPDSGARDGAVVFIAEAPDFTGFHSWPKVAITTDIAPGDSHINGPRHVFYNHAPPPGSTSFPVGTMLVKETDPGPVTGRTVFASVKRGGNYDPTGDRNWEWFSLQNLPNGTERILWRGPGPAAGGVYGNGALGGCNACHGVAKPTDYVFTPQLEAMIEPPDATSQTVTE